VQEFNAGRQAIAQNIAGLLLVREATDQAKAADTIRGGAWPSRG
jgi:hypothetical protein